MDIPSMTLDAVMEEVQKSITVEQAELMLAGIDGVKIEKLDGVVRESAVAGHTRMFYCVIDGELYRVTTVTKRKDMYGN